MNKIYKVVWNKARHCYMVGSEFISSHSTGSMSKRGSKSLAAALAVCAVCSMGTVFAAGPSSDTTTQDITVDGTPTTVTDTDTTYSVAVIFDTTKNKSLRSIDAQIIDDLITNNQSVTSGIALGKNAAVNNQNGRKASAILFGNPSYTSGIAIGENSYALTDSVNIGIKNYTSKIGNVDLSESYDRTGASGVGVTNIGSNSYSSGTLSTMIGSYSIMTTDYLNGYNGFFNSPAFQNWGAVSVGSLNSIESYGSHASQSGIANSIVGVANRTQNSNGSLIFGTGNEITNSIGFVSTGYGDSVTAMQKSLMDSAAQGNGGGAVLAIGGGNKADYVLHSQMTGVNNSITGTDKKSAEYDMVTGYCNTVNGSSYVTVIGSGNKVTNGDNNVVIGDNHTLENQSNNIILGSADKALSTAASQVTILGHNANATFDGGVALGAGSVANREAGFVGYNPLTGNVSVFSKDDATGYVWKATKGAVSVGSEGETRQIINVAAGTNDTDAVNVAQLKKALIDIDAGTGIKVDKMIKDGKTTYKISTNIEGSKTDTDTTTVTPNKTDAGSTDMSQGTTEDKSYSTGDKLTIGTETKATSFGADDSKTANVKPGEKLSINGDKKNISTSVNGNSIQVKLNDEIDVKKVTAETVSVGNTTITTDGLTIKDGPSITKDGINGGNQTITGVAAGDISATSTDAVNGSQLFATNQQVAQNAQSINKLSNRINKVGAGAAALAALHPLDFDPDAKWDFAAGYGNYNGENAAAIGAYYRPNEDTMFSVGGTFGNGENMVNAGVSFKLGSGSSHVSTSRVAMAKEIKELRGELEAMKSAMLDANAGKKIDTSKLQLFPDVPQNHWAYEYVAQLAGNGMIEGYSDGNFAGDRPMTRYEFAAILYRAMTKGAVLSDKILSEFSHELEYFTVDTVAKDKAGNPTIQRVRTVKENINK